MHLIKFILAFLLIPATLSGQSYELMPEFGFKYVTRGQQLPDKLTSSRTMVIFNTTDEVLISGEWREITLELQQYLVNVKVDGVAWFYLQDYLASRASHQEINSMLNYRAIQNVLTVDYFPDTTKADFELKLMPYSSEEPPFKNGTSAWMIEGDDLKQLVRVLGQDIIRSEMRVSNYLIPDKPEFFSDFNVLKKRRFPSYTKDIRIEKLAVPLFDSIQVKNLADLSPQLRLEVNKYNSQVRRKNEELADIMSAYPYEYELLPYNEDRRFYFSNGFQFMLSHIHARGETIRKMLNYELNRNETDYISVVNTPQPRTRKYPIEQPVHKFYLTHTISENVFIGDVWDAGSTWQEALRNFLTNNLAVAKR